MSNGARALNIARLMTTFNLEIEMVPDNLKCAECKSVLKDACQVPCGCHFCRVCIDAVMTRGAQFCLGGSQECGETPLSTAVPDYNTNRSISRLSVKCPMLGCSHECPLADMEGHLQVCPRKSVDCPFLELGCRQSKLTAGEMSEHLQQEICSHSEILIGVVANINREMAVLKRGDQVSREEFEMLKYELLLKDEQMMTIIDEMRHLQNEIKLIESEKSIKRETEIPTERQELDGQIESRREIDKSDCARIGALTGAIGSNLDALATQVGPAKDYFVSIGRDIQAMKSDIDLMKSQLQLTQVAVGLGEVDASCDDWLIDVDVSRKQWGKSWANVRTSERFAGAARPYRFQLESWNHVSSGELGLYLNILAGPSDARLDWPFRGAVTVTVAHRCKRDRCSRQTRQCRIERPPENRHKSSNRFVFLHSELRAMGLDLNRGVRVSCQIVPGAAGQ